MIDSVPSRAPTSPPETGASNAAAPIWAAASNTIRATAGAIELMSISSIPALVPAITPFSPRYTCSTSGESGSIVITTSVRSATS